jgi:hypothetical protein
MSTQGGPRGRERAEREGPRPAPRGPDDGENFGGNGQPGLHQSRLPRTMREKGECQGRIIVWHARGRVQGGPVRMAR